MTKAVLTTHSAIEEAPASTALPPTPESAFWKAFFVINIAHSEFHLQRVLLAKIPAIGHDNTSQSEYRPHSLAETLQDKVDFNLDENGEAATIAFNAFSIVYVFYLMVLGGKLTKDKLSGSDAEKEQAKEHLPNLGYAIKDAALWGCNNLISILLANFAQNAGVAAVASSSVFSLALLLDTVNSVKALNAAIDKNQEAQNNAQDGIEKELLKTEGLVLQLKRANVIAFSVLASAGAACLLAANVLSLTESGAVSAAATHLAYSGAGLLTGAALAFTVCRFATEMYGHTKNYQIVSAEIKKIDEINAKLDPSNKEYTYNLARRDTLVQKQRTLKYEMFKSVVYYTTQLAVMSTTYVFGPIAGLIAFGVFFVAHQVIKHVVEPIIVKQFNLEDKPLLPAVKSEVTDKPDAAPTPAATPLLQPA